eukprot:957574-Pelagomonas_calceolata.AAC.5
MASNICNSVHNTPHMLPCYQLSILEKVKPAHAESSSAHEGKEPGYCMAHPLMGVSKPEQPFLNAHSLLAGGDLS